MSFARMRLYLSSILVLQWSFNVYCASTLPRATDAAPSASATMMPGPEDDLADFGQVVPILGLMERTDRDFKDGLVLDLFSPQNRTLKVLKNTSPLPGRFVTGTSGEPFVALSNYSWIIQVNDTARDLIAKVELPYDPEMVQRKGCNVANTYVGIRSNDGKSWRVDESRHNVHISENKTRIIKLTSLDGEYMLLGRQTLDIANIFVQYGFGATRTVNVTGGSGIQQAEFIDGLRLTVESENEMRINVNLQNGIDSKALPVGMRSLNSFAWAVNSSAPQQKLKTASVRFPVNTHLLSPSKNETSINPNDLIVVRRDLNASSTAAYKPVARKSQNIDCRLECQVEVLNLQQLDGEYAIVTAEKERKIEEDAIRQSSASSPASSVSATLRKDLGWMWMLWAISVYATLSPLKFYV